MNNRIPLDGANASPSSLTTIRISPENLDKWMHQNRADYTGDIIEGCLLDNFVLICKRGWAAVYEHYLNCWTSDYLIEFQPGAAQEVWQRWHQFEERCEKVFAECT